MHVVAPTEPDLVQDASCLHVRDQNVFHEATEARGGDVEADANARVMDAEVVGVDTEVAGRASHALIFCELQARVMDRVR